DAPGGARESPWSYVFILSLSWHDPRRRIPAGVGPTFVMRLRSPGSHPRPGNPPTLPDPRTCSRTSPAHPLPNLPHVWSASGVPRNGSRPFFGRLPGGGRQAVSFATLRVWSGSGVVSD